MRNFSLIKQNWVSFSRAMQTSFWIPNDDFLKSIFGKHFLKKLFVQDSLNISMLK